LLAVGAAIGQAAPGGVVFFIFPPALALLGMFASRWWQPAEKAGSAAAILFLYLTWGAMLGLLEELLNGGPMWIFAPLSALLIIPLLIEARPLIVASGTRAVSIVSGLFVLLGTGAMLAAPAYSADRQQRFSIQHVSDVSNNKSWWSVLNDAAPLPAAFEGKWKRGKLPFSQPKPVEFIILGGKQPLPAIAAPLIAGRPRFARPQYNRDEAIAFRTRRL